MNTTVQYAGLIAAGLSLAISSLGLLTVWYYRDKAKRYEGHIIAFSAGLLLAASCLHLIPEALGVSPHAGIFLLAGYAVLAMIGLGGGRDGETASSSVLIPFLGIALHSTLDGFIYVVSYNHNILSGILTTSGLIIHEFSEATILFILLIQTGITPMRAAILTFTGSALTTPLGALAGVAGMNTLVTPALMGPLLAISAGALVCVAATHLLPRVIWRPWREAGLMFVTGMIVSLAGASLQHM